MHWPTFEGRLTQATEFRVGYDDMFIYVSVLCRDSNPDLIQAPSFRRDEWDETSDQIAIGFDTYDDNENALLFVTTPTGSRIDVSFRNDAQGSGAFNISWDSYWIAESTIHEEGWSTELRIPFSSLRFEVNDGKVNMGMYAYRYVARKREMGIFPAIPPVWLGRNRPSP
jgi:hypothetical protein